MFNRNRLMAQMALNGMNAKDVAKALGIDVSTFHRKVARDGDFSRSEINAMIDVLKIDEPKEIFFA